MSENDITLEPTEKKNIQSITEAEEKYDVHVIQGKLRVAENSSGLSSGRKMVAGDRAEVQLYEGEGLWFRNIGLNNAVLEITEVRK